MIKVWIEKVKQSVNLEDIRGFFKRSPVALRAYKVFKSYQFHIVNIFILLAAYILSSLIFYPEFSLWTCIKEIFSILCLYGAIFCWFMGSFSQANVTKICLAVTTCLSPVIFINNTFSVAIVCLVFIILIEYVILSYLRGCRLFSDTIPVYVICETEQDFEIALSLADDYKVLSFILLTGSTASRKTIKLSKLKTVQSVEKHLSRISFIPFFPMPRRLIYCASQFDSSNVQKLLDVSVRYSIPLLKANVSNNCIESLCPPTLDDLSNVSALSDKNPLGGLFKNKNIWICYDGRKVVADFICVLAGISSVHLTIVCESESLISKIRCELQRKCNSKNYRIKFADLPFLCMNEAHPDILFYNMPIKSRNLTEDCLKESLVKNVIDTNSLIKLSQDSKIPMVFVLSNLNSVNASDWAGATQRLGELFCQYADFQHRKTHSRFRVIRVPESPEDSNSAIDEITSSLLISGRICVDASESDLKYLYDSQESLPLLIKSVVQAIKSESSAEVFTIIPKEKVSLNGFIKKICDLFYLKRDRDIQVVHNHKNENMELDNFPNISENLEKTSVPYVFVTGFVASAIGSYNRVWTVEEVSKMNPREIIAAVFQSLSEKIHKRN